jgi:hypothetical protein
MRGVQTKRGITLNAAEKAAAIDVRGDPVEDEVTQRIGHKMQRAVAGKIGNLEIGPVELLLQGDDVVKVALELTLIEGG